MGKTLKIAHITERLQKRFFLLFKSVLFLLYMILISINSFAQNQHFNIKISNASLEDAILQIEKLSGYDFVYLVDDLKDVKVENFSFTDVTIDEALKECLKNTDLYYELENNLVVIKKQNKTSVQQPKEKTEITGKVLDENGNPLPGATVMVSALGIGTTTDNYGTFKVKVTDLQETTLTISFIGLKTRDVNLKGKKSIIVYMEADITEVEEVVATGYYKRAQNSFTGTATVIKAEQIKQVTNTNVMQALSTLDPSFKIAESAFGSDPNRLPEIDIRGKGSFYDPQSQSSEYDPNRPTFILDGFEVSFQTVNDLNMDRIESITLLKDAAATAIYGSRAANGVVVIETKKGESGKLHIRYNGSMNVQAPDLSVYNLTNAAEKLEVERLAGMYKYPSFSPDQQLKYDLLYNEKLYAVKQGVDTYWLAQPVSVGVGQRHSLDLEGGDKYTTYALSFGYDDKKGVMKGSDRTAYDINSRLQYNWKSLTFRNQLRVQIIDSNESPYGSFNQYALLNPYYKMKDENGNILPQLGTEFAAYKTGQVRQNPVYEAVAINNKSFGKSTLINDNFTINWAISENLRLKGSIGYTRTEGENHWFKSPDSYSFASLPVEERGRYTISSNTSSRYETSAVLSYYKNMDNHLLNFVLGGNLNQSIFESSAFTGIGFTHDRLDYISWASSYDTGTPTGSETIDRLAGAFLNLNYTYKERYLFDASLRMDGSSKFGKLQQSAPFWSIGAGWHVHKENWIPRNIFPLLRLKANVGTVGSTSFQAYQALTRYNYNNEDNYNGLVGAQLMALGNENLKWQSTIMRNVGIEASVIRKEITFNFNFYSNLSEDAVTNVSIAPSTGFVTYASNLGTILNQGIELAINAQVINKKNSSFGLFVNSRHNSNIIKEISDGMKAYNDAILERQESQGNDIGRSPESNAAAMAILQFYEGKSMYSIYAVPSLGIDPITGEEVYMNRFGEKTYKWDAYDQVEVGQDNPDLEGSFGFYASYKNLKLNTSIRYSLGAQVYNSTVVNRVENALLEENVDKRVLEDRWQKPGDLTYYKGIENNTLTRVSSRFVQDEYMMSLSSLQLSYRLSASKMKSVGMSGLHISATVNDLFQISTIKQERGIYYPYARTFSLSLSAEF